METTETIEKIPMSVEEAVALMKTSKNIEEWNDNREKVKQSYADADGNVPFTQWFNEKIDCHGLVVDVLHPEIREKYTKTSRWKR